MWDIKIIEKEKSTDGNYTAIATWNDAEHGSFSISAKVNEKKDSQQTFSDYITQYRDEWLERKRIEKAEKIAKQENERNEITELLTKALN